MRKQQKKRHRKSYNEPGHAHELTFSCYRGYAFLTKDRTCEWLAASVREACEELEFSLWAYVFMPNHVHLIVHPEQPGYRIAEAGQTARFAQGDGLSPPKRSRLA